MPCLLVALCLSGCFVPVDECAPLTCEDQPFACGVLSDGCGGTVDCGTKCPTGTTCGGAGVPNQCGYSCRPATCASLHAFCGLAGDGCGGVLNCGTCYAPNACGGAGVPNACGTADGGCEPKTCAQVGATCGLAPNGCGAVLDCGSCAAPDTCGGGGIPNSCGCKQKSCSELGASCGAVSDGCGGVMDCGNCAPPQTCGGGGTPNSCGCTRRACASQGKDCGSIDDGCGGTVDCGSCAAPKTCGATVANVCGCAGIACDPAPTLSAYPAGTRIELAWTDPSSQETGFELQRSLDGVNWSAVATTAANTTYYSDSTVSSGATVRYRVRVVGVAGVGAWSNVASASVSPTANVWRTVGADYQHTGVNPSETGAPPLTLAWSTTLAGGQVNPVVVENGRVFATCSSYFSSTTKLFALDLGTGTQAWSYDVGNVFSIGHPTVDSGSVYVGHCNNSSNTKMWSFNASNGGVNWSVAMGAQWEIFWAPVVYGGAVYTNAGSYGGMYAFETATGANRFFKGLDQYDEWSPAEYGGAIYSFMNGKLRAHDPQTGNEQWLLTVPWNWNGYSMDTYPVFGAGYGFIIAPPVLYAVDPATHAVAWSLSGLSFKGAPAYNAGTVYGLSAGNLRAHDARTGTYLWTFVGDGALSNPPVFANGYMYVSSAANVYAVDLTSHAQVWTAQGGGWLSIAQGKLLVAGASGVLKAYNLTP